MLNDGYGDFPTFGQSGGDIGVILSYTANDNISASCKKICSVPEDHNSQHCMDKWVDIRWVVHLSRTQQAIPASGHWWVPRAAL